MTKEWYLSTSDDYLSGFENEEFSLNATSAFEEILNNSPESYIVQFNGLDIKVIIQSNSDSQKRKMLSRIDTFQRGDMLTHKSFQWLVLDFVDDNRMNQSSIIQLCNTSITIKGERVPIDWDQWGNPIKWSDGEDKSFICIADKSLVYGSADMNNAINLPDNKIKVIIPYTDLKFDRFTLYNEPYIVRDIDLTQSINGKGLISITGERIVEKA